MTSYDSRQSTNSQFFDDRRVINNSTSLRITVANNSNNIRNNNTNEINNDYRYSSDARLLNFFKKVLFIFIGIHLESRLSEYEFNEEEEEQYDEEEDDNEEVAINNLQTVRRNT